jgi:predicted AlkP superfamily phosphohydrolase/phosphomutase
MARPSAKARRRVLFIGLDAADTELIEKWCEEGFLPNISRMRSQGAWARMRTTAEVVHVSAWPSIFTGTTADKHGLYHAYVMNPGQQSPVRPRPDSSPFPFLWRLLSDQGKRCVIMDAFMTCPLQNFNGAQIVEWGTWSWFSEPAILPPTLKRELEKEFGPYPAEDHSKVGMVPPECKGFHLRLLAAVAKKSRVVKWLLEREEWDLFLVVFGECHPAGHYFWHFQDPAYIAHPQNGDVPLRNGLRDVYVALDRAVGEILEVVDSQTTVFLVSGDGMGPNYSGSHILTPLLGQMGMFNHAQAAGDCLTAARASKPKRDLLSTLRGMLPKRLRLAVSRAILPRSINEKLSLHWKTAGIAWNRTRAFLIENANEGYVRINLKGREPEGIVEPGDEYRTLCEDIYQTAKSLVNPANGRRAAQAVYKTDDIFQGPCRSHMPDIIITWNEAAEVTTQLLAEKYGLVTTPKPGYALPPYYTGNHRPNAFMVTVGPEIPQGAVLEDVHVLDIAPTLLTCLGIQPPGHMDGKLVAELLAAQDVSRSAKRNHPSRPSVSSSA